MEDIYNNFNRVYLDIEEITEDEYREGMNLPRRLTSIDIIEGNFYEND